MNELINKEFQMLQSDLMKYLNEDEVTTIAIGISNSDIEPQQKVDVLKSILKVFLNSKF